MILPFLRALPAGALGLVFIVAGILKAVDPTEFVRQIETYGIVSGSLAVILAYTLLPLEIGLGSALLAGYRARLAAAATVILLLVFMSATAYAWSQGKTEGCGCFGSIASRTPGQVLVEDTGLLGLGAHYYIPVGAFQETLRDSAFLTKTNEEIKGLGWERKPDLLEQLV